MKTKNFDLDNKVTQSNDLIRSIWTMDSVSLKLFEMAVSCIDPINSADSCEVRLKKSDIFKMFDSKGGDKYSRFRNHLKRLQRQIVSVYDVKEGRISQFVAVPTVTWLIDDNFITLEFNKHLMPYLVQLKGNFTQYEIGNIQKMSSKYAILLYKLAKMNSWKSSTFSIGIDQLRQFSDTVTEYPRFQSFETRVLRSPIDEINNSNADLLIGYEKIRSGKRVIAIRFMVRERLSYKDNDFFNPKGIDSPFAGEFENDPNQMTIDDFNA